MILKGHVEIKRVGAIGKSDANKRVLACEKKNASHEKSPGSRGTPTVVADNFQYEIATAVQNGFDGTSRIVVDGTSGEEIP